ncbi:hypothetical protein [Streptomyces griseosporeus]|uniref:hypothetical protein n=1 Tax=Streptomyces griseosporeus TaxID=1910 RepID=UPI0036FAFFCA
MTDRLTPKREAEIAARAEAAYPGPWRRSEEGLERTVLSEDDVVAISFGYRGNNTQAEADFVAHAREDVPALLAELAAVRAERDELAARARRVAVSHEHFIYDHADPGAEALASQYELLNYLSAMPGETELPVNPVESALRLVLALLDEWDENITPGEIRKSLAEFLPRDDASDNRRRIYIDGKGNGWISVCHDEGTEWVVPVEPAAHVEQDIRDVADETGSLREIGRCW